MAATIDEVLAVTVIAVGWLLLSRALARACRQEDTPQLRCTDNPTRGEFPIASGPVNGDLTSTTAHPVSLEKQ